MPVPPAADVRVEYEQPCIGCGYALRGLPVTGVCPECGMAIARSFRGDRLAAADPAYVGALLRGATLLLASAVAVVALWIGTMVIATLLAGAGPRALLEWTVVAGLLVIAALGTGGVMKLTAPDPEDLNGSLWHSGRLLARPGAIAASAGVLGAVILEVTPARNSVAAAVAIAVGAGGLLAVCAGMGLVTHALARRSGERRLVKRLRVVATLFALACGLLAVGRLIGDQTALGLGSLVMLGAAIGGLGMVEQLRGALKRDYAAARLRRASVPAAGPAVAPEGPGQIHDPGAIPPTKPPQPPWGASGTLC